MSFLIGYIAGVTSTVLSGVVLVIYLKYKDSRERFTNK